MRFLLPLLAVISVASAAVVRRDVGTASDVGVSGGLHNTPLAASATPGAVATLNETVTGQADVEGYSFGDRDNDVVELFVQKGNKGQYYRYTARDTDDYICVSYQRLVGEQILSVRQMVPAWKQGHVRCDYHTEPYCGTAEGKMTHTDSWEQPDLAHEPRKRPGDDTILGDWADRIHSVQCFWVRSAARQTEVSTTKKIVPDHANIEANSISVRDRTDVVELYTELNNEGRYYYYSILATDDYICQNIYPKTGDRILSARQKQPLGKGHVRCDYYAEFDCGGDRGKMTKTDLWEQTDLRDQPRMEYGERVGSWEDQILSLQCFWVRSAARQIDNSNSLSDTSVTAPVYAGTQFDGLDPVELHTKKENKGKYKYYTIKEVSDYICKNIQRTSNERVLSARQKKLPNHSHMRCDYYAEPDCGAAQGKLTRTDDWEQPDLASEPRNVGGVLLGNWEDQIHSVQCFWVRSAARSIEETGALLESTNAHDDGLHIDTSNGPAYTFRTPATKDLELRDASTHNNDRLTVLYAGSHFIGDIVGHATQQDAEREYCLKTNLQKGVFVRSIRQNKDSEDSWFVCWYYDDDHCNSEWNPNGVFPAFYIERDGFILSDLAYKIMSFRCHYADPSRRAAVPN